MNEKIKEELTNILKSQSPKIIVVDDNWDDLAEVILSKETLELLKNCYEIYPGLVSSRQRIKVKQ